jgi:TonB-dependent SusC/RagA subfamily outer membrane receptor
MIRSISFVMAAALLAAGILACTTQRDSTGTTRPPVDANTIHEPQANIDLTDHLRRVPGVYVQGNGPDARITIRGTNSINSGTEPLFVLDGSPMVGSFSGLYNFINVNDIQLIKVIKDPAQLAMYGVQGANGVIEIYLKK